ncbi:MAG: hypothetical protein CM1200mP39_28050 [Dehalococcoidia bacterium]|nr:MAG: hypothetical protein CM1200mP39_28050 [Dehalococcoidia bacterium]
MVHAGTSIQSDGTLITDGGRVLGGSWLWRNDKRFANCGLRWSGQNCVLGERVTDGILLKGLFKTDVGKYSRCF